jgi:predicted enzyme related to lactoylglutathione lyase
MKMNPVVHFEMPAKDKKRVSDFYSKAFGWDMQITGEEYGGYILAMTTESDEKGPKKPGEINGGFFDYGDYGKIPHLVISVDNLDEHMKTVEKEGGKILKEPMDIPNVGKFVMIEDTEGNHVGMLQPITM